MSEEQLHKQSRQPVLKEAAGNSPADSRRRLLKGTLAIPVIMTLHSGAALAATSNLVPPTQIIADAVKNEDGDLICIHPDGSDPRVESVGKDPRVDLGENPTISFGEAKNADGSADLQTQAELCQNNRGILVSQAAWNSIGPIGGASGSSTTTL